MTDSVDNVAAATVALITAIVTTVAGIVVVAASLRSICMRSL